MELVPVRRFQLFPVDPVDSESMSFYLQPTTQTQQGWSVRSSLWLIIAAPVAPLLIGSLFNIWYNLVQVEPMLTSEQHELFIKTIQIYNALVYPLAVALWGWIVLSLRHSWQQLVDHQPIAAKRLLQSQKRAINLPWWGAALAGVGWFLCIPVFLLVLANAPDAVDPRVYVHLPISFIISALIAITHGFFAIELLSQRLLYPSLFQETHPTQIPGAFPLSLRSRGLIWAVSAGICPIISLMLLSLAPHPDGVQAARFTLTVGVIGIIFALTSAWMVDWLVIEPVNELKQTAQAVSAGNFNLQIPLRRADELGLLIDEFNRMILELRHKQHLQETFGRHVGQKAAQRILQENPDLKGAEQEISVLFADLRDFTSRCSRSSPQEIVTLLNLFLSTMVEIVEQRHGGMVNKFLGDGFMALFGIEDEQANHAARAVAAGKEMLVGLQRINGYLTDQGQPPLAMGIGIHTGLAVIGSIGSRNRLEYTAIGDTVNVAARVESLTKKLGKPLLMTVATQIALPASVATQPVPPQSVKGQRQPLSLFCLKS